MSEVGDVELERVWWCGAEKGEEGFEMEIQCAKQAPILCVWARFSPSPSHFVVLGLIVQFSYTIILRAGPGFLPTSFLEVLRRRPVSNSIRTPRCAPRCATHTVGVVRNYQNR